MIHQEIKPKLCVFSEASNRSVSNFSLQFLAVWADLSPAVCLTVPKPTNLEVLVFRPNSDLPLSPAPLTQMFEHANVSLVKSGDDLDDFLDFDPTELKAVILTWRLQVWLNVFDARPVFVTYISCVSLCLQLIGFQTCLRLSSVAGLFKFISLECDSVNSPHVLQQLIVFSYVVIGAKV